MLVVVFGMLLLLGSAGVVGDDCGGWYYGESGVGEGGWRLVVCIEN